MPLGRKLAIGSDDAARRQRAELRISYGNKLSNMNLDRLRCRHQCHTGLASASQATTTTAATTGTASLRRIASSFAQVSDVNCGACAALPLEDSEDDVREELAEVLIRSEPFKRADVANNKTSPAAMALPVVPRELATPTPTLTTEDSHRQHPNSCSCCTDAVLQSRACERWNQIAGTVSSLFRVRRFHNAHPLSELRRLREQRDLLENFTRPFLYEDTK
ncbi:hypothetical protein KR093_004641 [Drosophila rubida]|uniref:Uncharacterized protein n=1 Tax=Drosophila rubida TaxID=30044 RepID=A0AAD4KBB1_9MUSC|nr:hypothetical protein KR093_004641 [Drosophila rubida]